MTDVTLSTKAWEGDYRQLLDPVAWQQMWAPWGPAARRQLVLNRVHDRADAQARAEGLVAAGLLDELAWAEDLWPELARSLKVSERWFGAAWPFAVPELVELWLARTPVVAHQAGDVRLEPGEPWLPRALAALSRQPEVALVSPVSPSRIELVRPEARGATSGWVRNLECSDQCFVGRPAQLLTADLVRATHVSSGIYPKPGGALTFEARVGSWLRSTGHVRLVDVTRGYLHPSDGTEGDSYLGLAGPAEFEPAAPRPSSGYPPPGSVAGTAVVLAHNDAHTIGWTTASLKWLNRVLVIDLASEDATAERAGVDDVEHWPVDPVSRRAALPRAVKQLQGWVLVVDGDELVPAALAHELASAFARGELRGVEVAVDRFELGARTTPLPPELRAFHADAVEVPFGLESLREPLRLKPGGTSTTCTSRLVRLGAPDLHAWVTRANDESSLLSRGTTVPANVSLRRAARQAAMEFRRQGGGRNGWRRAALVGLRAWLLSEKAWELVHGGGPAVRAAYDDLARDLVEGGAAPKR